MSDLIKDRETLERITAPGEFMNGRSMIFVVNFLIKYGYDELPDRLKGQLAHLRYTD